MTTPPGPGPTDNLTTDPPRPPGTPDVDELVGDPVADDGGRTRPGNEDVDGVPDGEGDGESEGGAGDVVTVEPPD